MCPKLSPKRSRWQACLGADSVSFGRTTRSVFRGNYEQLVINIRLHSTVGTDFADGRIPTSASYGAYGKIHILRAPVWKKRTKRTLTVALKRFVCRAGLWLPVSLSEGWLLSALHSIRQNNIRVEFFFFINYREMFWILLSKIINILYQHFAMLECSFIAWDHEERLRFIDDVYVITSLDHFHTNIFIVPLVGFMLKATSSV